MPQIDGGPKGLNSILEGAYSSARAQGHDKGTASAIAWSAAKNKYKKHGESWVRKLYTDLSGLVIMKQREIIQTPQGNPDRLQYLVFAMQKMAEFMNPDIAKSAIESLSVDDVEENPLNRDIDRAKVDSMKSKIKESGSVKPLVYVEIDKDGSPAKMITDGHHRLVALKELGYKSFPARMSDENGVRTTAEDQPVKIAKDVASTDVQGLDLTRQDLQSTPKKKKPLEVTVKFEKAWSDEARESALEHRKNKALKYAADTVPPEKMEAVKAYINTDKFHADVERHKEDMKNMSNHIPSTHRAVDSFVSGIGKAWSDAAREASAQARGARALGEMKVGGAEAPYVEGTVEGKVHSEEPHGTYYTYTHASGNVISAYKPISSDQVQVLGEHTTNEEADKKIQEHKQSHGLGTGETEAPHDPSSRPATRSFGAFNPEPKNRGGRGGGGEGERMEPHEGGRGGFGSRKHTAQENQAGQEPSSQQRAPESPLLPPVKNPDEFQTPDVDKKPFGKVWSDDAREASIEARRSGAKGNKAFEEPFHSGHHIQQFLGSNDVVIGSVDKSKLSSEKNAARQKEFESTLDKWELPYKKGHGVSSEWGNETSYIVHAPRKEDAESLHHLLTRTYKQDAVIHVRNGHAVMNFNGGTNEPIKHANIKGGIEAGDHLTDNYTNVDGQKFRINFK